MGSTYRLCGVAGCDFRTAVDMTSHEARDAAWEATQEHCKTEHGMTGSEAAHFVSWHSKTITKEK